MALKAPHSPVSVNKLTIFSEMRYDHGSDLAYFMLFPMTPVVLLLVSLILKNNFKIGNYIFKMIIINMTIESYIIYDIFISSCTFTQNILITKIIIVPIQQLLIYLGYI